ncbi:hypothetical protein D3C87_1489120 [compost metagenome]
MIDLCPTGRLWQCHRRDQFGRLQDGFHIWRVPWQAMQVNNRNGARPPVGTYGFHRRVEHSHRNRHIARMGGDAGLADTKQTQRSAGATNSRTAAARCALVAGLVGVVEVRTAGALQQIAGRRGAVAQLPRGAGQQGARQHAVVPAYAHVGRQISVAHQGADAQAPFGRRLDLVQRQAIDIDEVRGCLDLQLHQIQQIGAACNEAGLRMP